MARSKCALFLVGCALSLVFTACGGKPPSGGKAPGGGKAHSGPKNLRVEKFRLGHAFGQDGQVVDEGRKFVKGDTVYVSFAIVDAEPKAQARVVWVAKQAGTQLADETKPVADDAVPVGFTRDTTSWEPGTYMVETWVVQPGVNGVRKLGAADFSVASAPSAK